jgi:hypothetical protein
MIGVAAVWLCGGLCKVGGPASWGSGAWVSFGGWRSVEELYRVMTRESDGSVCEGDAST